MRRFLPFPLSLISRVVATAASLALLVGLATPAQAADSFGDVAADRWYSAPVEWLVSEGITRGTSPGCFSPYNQVTRGQVATFLFQLDQARGNDPQPHDHPFADVVRTYQQAPVGWAFASAITTGVSPRSFAPDDTVTRGDFAVLLWRYAGQPTVDTAHPFADVDRAYQNAAIDWMAATGITTGTTATTFSPDASMTRAEAATFLHRFMDQPIVVSVSGAASSEPAICEAVYAARLVEVGLTATEADCVAPFLTDLTLTDIDEILAGERPFDTELIALLSEILSADCIPTIDRQAALIRALL